MPPGYLEARRREGRLFTVEEAARLPAREPGASHQEEWAMRRHSLQRLLAHLEAGAGPRPILELGCGVGWLAATLARRLDRRVVGVDIHQEELAVGRQAFARDERVQLVLADVFAEPLPGAPFGTVILAASLQYFPDPQRLLDRLAKLGSPGAEVVILDTPIYRVEEVEAARARSREYYQGLGVPELADHYFHHSWAVLAPYAPEILYRPRHSLSWLGRRFGRWLSPFPIVRIVLPSA